MSSTLGNVGGALEGIEVRAREGWLVVRHCSESDVGHCVTCDNHRGCEFSTDNMILGLPRTARYKVRIIRHCVLHGVVDGHMSLTLRV